MGWEKSLDFLSLLFLSRIRLFNLWFSRNWDVTVFMNRIYSSGMIPKIIFVSTLLIPSSADEVTQQKNIRQEEAKDKDSQFFYWNRYCSHCLIWENFILPFTYYFADAGAEKEWTAPNKFSIRLFPFWARKQLTRQVKVLWLHHFWIR